MNTRAQTFGKAVHAVFPHFAAHGLCEESFNHFAAEQHRLNPALDWEHVHAIWAYVREIITASDKAWFEKKTPNGRHPDIMVRYGPALHVVEVKTMSWVNLKRLDRHQEDVHRILSQSLGAAKSLIRVFPGQAKHVFAYVLLFRSDLRWGEYEPEWVDLTPHINYDG